MTRSFVPVCVVVLLSAVGCSSSAFLLDWGGGGGWRQVTDGSVNEATAVLQARLADAGLPVVVDHKEDRVRLVGKTASGKAFCLVLRPDYRAGRKKTVVSSEGDAVGDAPFRQLVSAALERAPQEKERSPR